MSKTTTASARSALNRALQADKGIWVDFDSPQEAIRFRHSCNSVRARYRRQTMQIYSSDHPGHGVTEWDHLEVLIDPENKNRVLIQPAADIEDLEYGEL